MITTSWNDAEETLLQGLPVPAQVLYLRGLRRYMDYRTGVVGDRRGISLQQLRETLFVEPHKGMKATGLPSVGQIRRLLAWLERAGLIENRSVEGIRLVFFLPYADTDQCVQKIPGTYPAQSRHDEAATYPIQTLANNDAGLDGFGSRQPGTYPTQTRTGKPGTPPVSGIRNTTSVDTHMHVARAREEPRRAARKTPLPADFAISPAVREWAAGNGCHRLDEHFESFTLKAAARGYVYADWDAAFMNAIQENWAGLPVDQHGFSSPTQEDTSEYLVVQPI